LSRVFKSFFKQKIIDRNRQNRHDHCNSTYNCLLIARNQSYRQSIGIESEYTRLREDIILMKILLIVSYILEVVFSIGFVVLLLLPALQPTPLIALASGGIYLKIRIKWFSRQLMHYRHEKKELALKAEAIARGKSPAGVSQMLEGLLKVQGEASAHQGAPPEPSGKENLSDIIVRLFRNF
jgi:hypothetical protein